MVSLPRSMMVALSAIACAMRSPFTSTEVRTGSRALREKTPTTFIMAGHHAAGDLAGLVVAEIGAQPPLRGTGQSLRTAMRSSPCRLERHVPHDMRSRPWGRMGRCPTSRARRDRWRASRPAWTSSRRSSRNWRAAISRWSAPWRFSRRGSRSAQTCRKQLEEAETRVEILLKKNGKLQPEPFPADKE